MLDLHTATTLTATPPNLQSVRFATHQSQSNERTEASSGCARPSARVDVRISLCTAYKHHGGALGLWHGHAFSPDCTGRQCYLGDGFYCFSNGQLQRILTAFVATSPHTNGCSACCFASSALQRCDWNIRGERIASFQKQASRLTKKKRKLLLELSDAEPLSRPWVAPRCLHWSPDVRASSGIPSTAGSPCIPAPSCTTELQFAQDLLSALRLFREAARADAELQGRFAVFSNMKELAGLSSELLRDLQKEGDPIEVVANAFAHVAPFFMLYGTFCSNYDLALVELGRLQQEVSGLSAWLRLQSQSARREAFRSRASDQAYPAPHKVPSVFRPASSATERSDHRAHKVLAGACDPRAHRLRSGQRRYTRPLSQGAAAAQRPWRRMAAAARTAHAVDLGSSDAFLWQGLPKQQAEGSASDESIGRAGSGEDGAPPLASHPPAICSPTFCSFAVTMPRAPPRHSSSRPSTR